MSTVNIKIDGMELSVPKEYTVLKAARQNNIHIPTLCYLEGMNEIGACRICTVEIEGGRALQAACVLPVSEGMHILTNSKRVRSARKNNLELILSNHNRKCLTCIRNKNCELQNLADEFGIDEIRYEGKQDFKNEIDNLSTSIVRDNSKCILCRRCISACDNQCVSVIQAKERGFETNIGCAFDKSLKDVPCIYCGQCMVSCPTGALYEKNDIPLVQAAIDDKTKHTIVQTAPAVRAALGEEFGMPMGTPVTGKMVTALRMLGFSKVFDTDTGADLTIMEEGTEFIERFTKGENLPLITSCSPGWVKYCEHNYPDMLNHLSTAKSPMEMFAAILKSYYPQKYNIDKDSIFSVAIMPCTSKKFERARDEHSTSGDLDVDVSLTTRELARMIKQAGIDFVNLPDGQFDVPFGEATGAGVIFGATGGVMEAAVRTVYEILEGKPMENLEIAPIRGVEGVKEATLTILGKPVKVAVVHGTKNAKYIMDKVKAGEKYDFIEVMACPGGCVNGGGQPVVSAQDRMGIDLRAERAKALYTEDRKANLRKSHENPAIQELYREFLEKPCSHKSHKYLHTTYQKRENY